MNTDYQCPRCDRELAICHRCIGAQVSIDTIQTSFYCMKCSIETPFMKPWMGFIFFGYLCGRMDVSHL